MIGVLLEDNVAMAYTRLVLVLWFCVFFSGFVGPYMCV